MLQAHRTLTSSIRESVFVIWMLSTNCVHSHAETRCQISRNKHVVADCAAVSISVLPISLPKDVHTLILARNIISKIPADAFIQLPNVTLLDLSKNKITTVDKLAFRGLFQLRELNLNNNRFRMGYNAFPKGVFAPCAASLHVLLLSSVVLSTYHQRYPTKSLAPLTQLRYLLLPVVRQFTVPQEFSSMSSLRTLEFHRGFLYKLTSASLDVVRRMNVTSLSFRAVDLRRLEPHTFSDFPRLRSINLACNYKLGLVTV